MCRGHRDALGLETRRVSLCPIASRVRVGYVGPQYCLYMFESPSVLRPCHLGRQLPGQAEGNDR